MKPTLEIWHPNHPPTSYPRIAVDLESKQKKALINYSKACGSNLSTIIRHLVDRLLAGDIYLDFTPPVIKRRKS